MNGKIFSGSHDLYDDQAEILFAYYKEAAEKIVAQEEAIEKEIAEIKDSQATIGETTKKQQMNLGIAGGVAALGVLLFFLLGNETLLLLLGLGVGGFLGIRAFSKIQAGKKFESESGEKIRDLQKKFDSIFRDYKVEKLGVAYVPVATQVPFDEKSFFIDHTGQFAEKQFQLQLVNDQKTLNEKMMELDALSTSAPLVEKGDEVEEIDTDDYSRSIQKVKFYDYFGRMDRNLRTSAYCLSDVRTASVSMPIIPPESSYIDFYTNHATTDTGTMPVIPVFNVNRYDKAIEEFKNLNDIRKTLAQQNEQFEDVLRRLIANVGYAVQTIAALKVASSHKLVQRSNDLLFNILKASYNHYSPLLEKEELDKMRSTDFNYSDTVDKYTPFQLKESSRVRYDVSQGKWAAEDGSWTLTPFGISQVQEEIVAPIVQNLMAETRIERLRYYNDIKNQKINYLNQWHQDTEDFYGRNRASSDDLINIMRSNLTKFLAAQATLNNLESMKKQMREQARISDDDTSLEQKMSEDLVAFEVQAQGFKNSQDDFENYMDRMKEDIAASAKRFGYIEYYDATLRDRMAKDIVDAGDSVAELDERRRPLVSINPLYAKTSIIPPKPMVEDCVDEQFSVNVATMAVMSLKDIDEAEGDYTPSPQTNTEAGRPSYTMNYTLSNTQVEIPEEAESATTIEEMENTSEERKEADDEKTQDMNEKVAELEEEAPELDDEVQELEEPEEIADDEPEELEEDDLDDLDDLDLDSDSEKETKK